MPEIPTTQDAETGGQSSRPAWTTLSRLNVKNKIKIKGGRAKFK
jgi:hypothetical protein